MNNVLGKVGVGGVPAFISIQKEFWPVYLIVTAIAIVVPCILTIVMSHFSKQKRKKLLKINKIKKGRSLFGRPLLRYKVVIVCRKK